MSQVFRADFSSRNDHKDSKVIPIYLEASQIEREVEDHLSSIRTLLRRLRPSERQKCFSSLMAQLLRQQMEYASSAGRYPTADAGPSALSLDELQLIKEASANLDLLYKEIGGE